MEVDRLIERLRQESVVRRAAAGVTRVPALDDLPAALRAIGSASLSRGTRPRLDDLRDLVDPTRVDLRSHRVVAGAAVRAVKHIVLRFVADVLGRQAAFNASAGDALAGLERRADRAARVLEGRLDALEAKAMAAAGRLAPADPAFDYTAFEAAFRSDEQLRPVLAGYARLIEGAGATPVLDLGCGRGDLLDALREAGLDARGVDADPGAVLVAKRRGLAVERGDLIEGLRAWPDGSLGAVTCLQVIEHLTVGLVRELLAIARRKLRPGGLFVAETVNVSSGFALAHGWSIDPTHRLRLHPRVLRALAEEAGFQDVDVRFSGTVEEARSLEADGLPGVPPSAAARLAWLLAPQDCAVIARAPRR